MGFQVSPGVEVKEIDLTNVIPAVSTSIGGYSGYFRWGPVSEIGLVSSEKELAAKYGTPDAAHTQSFLTAASFLKYGNALKVVRADHASQLNAVAGTHEVPSGGIEGVGISSQPTEFVSVTGLETLSIVETDGSGTGATIQPRYGVNTTTTAVAAGYTVSAVNPDTLVDGTYTIDVDGEDLTFTVASGVATIDTNIFIPNNTTTSVVEGSATVVLTFSAVTFTSSTATASPLGDFIDGDTLTVYTTNGDETSPAFTLTVTDSSGTPTFTVNAMDAAAVDSFSEFPTSTSGLKVYDAAGTLVEGLFVDAGYNIEAIASITDGSGYVIANTTVAITEDPAASPVVTTNLEAGNFTFDEQESEYSNPMQINNEAHFENIYPPVGVESLQGLLFARYPGELGNSLGAYVLDEASYGSAPEGVQAQFDAAPSGNEIHVYVYDNLGEITGEEGAELEKWSFLSTVAGAKLADGSNNNYKDVVNANSNYIYIARDIPSTSTAFEFGQGADSGEVDAGDIMTGLEVLADSELVDVNLLFAQVDPSGFTIANKLMSIASTRKDAVAFVSPPIALSTGNAPATDVVNYYNGSSLPRGIEGSYGVFDSTALYVYNKYADNYVWIPASGHMAGLCAKTDNLAEPWFSPAGLNRGSLLGVTKLAFNPKKAERDSLYKAGINPIVSFPGQGTVLFGDKTAQAKPSAFDRINVRRLFIVLEKAIATAAKYQLFELNDEFTRAMFRNMTEPFLRDVKGRRGITDFLVVCDETNNTGEVIDTNRFVADIYIKPARSINFITLNFIATRTGVDFSEIVGK